jgi:hypothetical protein
MIDTKARQVKISVSDREVKDCGARMVMREKG